MRGSILLAAPVPFKDVTKYSWGGDITLESGDYGTIYIRHGRDLRRVGGEAMTRARSR